jgi:hypothetical protein
MVDLRKIWIELDGNWTGEGKITFFFSFFFYAKKKKKKGLILFELPNTQQPLVSGAMHCLSNNVRRC